MTECDCCYAAGMCDLYCDSDNKEIPYECDEMLHNMVEDMRTEYYKAWFEYIDEERY